MPTYEYKCKKCKKNFEKFQSVAENSLKDCIYCDGEVNRVFHPPGIVFKGSGFYTTDNRKKEPKPAKAPSKTKKDEKAPACAKKDSCPSAANCN